MQQAANPYDVTLFGVAQEQNISNAVLPNDAEFLNENLTKPIETIASIYGFPYKALTNLRDKVVKTSDAISKRVDTAKKICEKRDWPKTNSNNQVRNENERISDVTTSFLQGDIEKSNSFDRVTNTEIVDTTSSDHKIEQKIVNPYDVELLGEPTEKSNTLQSSDGGILVENLTKPLETIVDIYSMPFNMFRNLKNSLTETSTAITTRIENAKKVVRRKRTARPSGHEITSSGDISVSKPDDGTPQGTIETQ